MITCDASATVTFLAAGHSCCKFALVAVVGRAFLFIYFFNTVLELLKVKQYPFLKVTHPKVKILVWVKVMDIDRQTNRSLHTTMPLTTNTDVMSYINIKCQCTQQSKSPTLNRQHDSPSKVKPKRAVVSLAPPC